MKAIVIGGNGFVGSHLVDLLLEKRWTVRIFDHEMERYRSPLQGVEYKLGNFNDCRELNKALVGMDIVFHLISTTVPNTSNEDPVRDIEENLINTVKLLEECVKNKIKKIVFLSSGGAIYGSPKVVPISEQEKTNPESSYGITKLAIEKYLDLFNKLYGLEYVILRLSNPYGGRQNPYGIQGVVSVFLGKIHRNEFIEIWGDGSIIRDYIFIEDAVKGIYNAATINSKERIFNIGSGQGYSLNDLIDLIKRTITKDVKVNYHSRRFCDPKKIILNISHAEKELKWHPEIGFEEGILRTWDFVKNT